MPDETRALTEAEEITHVARAIAYAEGEDYYEDMKWHDTKARAAIQALAELGYSPPAEHTDAGRRALARATGEGT